MSLFRAASVPLCLLCLTTILPGQDTKTLLDKAIEAAGGEAKLKKYPALVLTGKGRFIVNGQAIPFTAVWHTDGIDQGRTLTEYVLGGAKVAELKVVSKNKGWVKDNQDPAKAMDAATLEEEQDSLYFNYVTMLAPLKGKDFKLTALPESAVDGKPALGIQVTHQKHRPVKLFFDKESNLLVKSERQVKDEGKLTPEEVFFSNYQEVNGLKVASKFVVKQSGQVAAEVEMTEIKPAEKLDPKLFAKP
jgi:hypothetical protein